MFYHRLLLLLGLLLLVGFATGALAAEPVDRNTPHVTRAEAVALIIAGQEQYRARVLWYQRHMPPLPLFTDVDQEEWYAPYVEVAFENGIVEGNPNRTFQPEDPILAEEAVTLITRFRQSQAGDQPLVLYLPNARHQWYGRALADALGQNIPMPAQLVIGQAIGRDAYYAMLGGATIASPRDIVFVTIPPPPSAPAPSASPAPHRAIALRPIRANAPSPSRAPAARPPTTASPQNPSMAFSISLPSLGINNLAVIHPTDPFSSKGLLAPLKNGVGHLFSYPGTDGKILIYGHSSSYPWDVSSYTKIFRQINRLNAGDRITVRYDGIEHLYEVTFKETVPAKDMSAYRNGGSEELILYTCWPPDSIKERYLVHAKPVERLANR